MTLFSKKDNGSKRSNTRVVVTGKRMKKGTWVMESVLPFKAKRSGESGAILETRNRRVRTLH